MFIVFGKETCPYCINTKTLLDESRKKYIYLPLEEEQNSDYVDKLISLKLIPEIHTTVPKVIKFKKKKGKSIFIGGYEDLLDYFERK